MKSPIFLHLAQKEGSKQEFLVLRRIGELNRGVRRRARDCLELGGGGGDRGSDGLGWVEGIWCGMRVG